VTFVGRLATYKYYNMDQVVAQALTAFKRLRERYHAADEATIVNTEGLVAPIVNRAPAPIRTQ
jgi:UDP-galactopyranose mutase